MRVSISKSDLTHLLGAVTKVVEHRNTIPILSNVVLTVADGRLTAKATDLDIETQASIAVLDAQDGATTVEAKLLADIAKRAAGDITMTQEGDVLVVKSGRSRFKLQTLPVEDYPTLDAGKFDVEFDVDIASLVEPVAFAMSNELTRFYLCGVCIGANGRHITATATDGHRLATKKTETDASFESIILPRKFVGLIPSGKVKFAVSKSKVRITSGDAVITSKLIDGTFPDYERVIPKSNDKILTVDTAALRTAASRVSVIASERGRGIKLSISDNSVTLTVNNPDAGNATEEVAAGFDGEPIDIGFNSQYLGDILAAFSGGDVTVALADSGSPTLVTSEDVPGFRAVIMPMRM